MAFSNLIRNNEEYIRDAINRGIDGSAISSTLNDVMDRSDMTKKNPTQVKEVIETIVSMKNKNIETEDFNYSSNFVRTNSDRIKSALNDGIEPQEIAETLMISSNNKDKRRLKFIVNLISKMKKKELKLRKQKEVSKGYQKVKK